MHPHEFPEKGWTQGHKDRNGRHCAGWECTFSGSFPVKGLPRQMLLWQTSGTICCGRRRPRTGTARCSSCRRRCPQAGAAETSQSQPLVTQDYSRTAAVAPAGHQQGRRAVSAAAADLLCRTLQKPYAVRHPQVTNRDGALFQLPQLLSSLKLVPQEDASRHLVVVCYSAPGQVPLLLEHVLCTVGSSAGARRRLYSKFRPSDSSAGPLWVRVSRDWWTGHWHPSDDC